MGVINRAKKAVEERVRPLSQEINRVAGIPLEEEGSVNRETDTDLLFKLLRRSPEVLSLIQAVVDDVIPDEKDYHFEYLGESSGQQARENAKRFWEGEVKEDMAQTLIDILATGDGYLYKRMMMEDQARAAIFQKNRDRFNREENAMMAADQLLSEMKTQQRAEFLQPSGTDMVPSSTVEHKINKYGDILQFEQSIDGGPSADIPPEKMVHFSYMKLDGGTYSFTPMRSIVSELQMLANVKDHNGKIFDNAAIVNKHFNLPNDDPDSREYKLFKEQVKQFRKLSNKHRDLITTGEVDVENLNEIGENMEFRNLAEYITRILVMAWGVPPTRIGMSISGDSGARVTSLTHQGYFRRIGRWQDKWFTTLNEELWEKHFNVRMHVEQPDTETQIKEADKDLRETDVVVKRMAAGLMNREAAQDYLNLHESDTMDLEDEEDQALMELAAQVQSGRDQQLSELEVFGEQADQEMQEDQQQVQPEED